MALHDERRVASVPQDGIGKRPTQPYTHAADGRSNPVNVSQVRSERHHWVNKVRLGRMPLVTIITGGMSNDELEGVTQAVRRPSNGIVTPNPTPSPPLMPFDRCWSDSKVRTDGYIYIYICI